MYGLANKLQKQTNEYIAGYKSPSGMRQMSKNIKNRSNSANCLQSTNLYERKNRLEIMLEQDRLPIKHHPNYPSIFSLINDCISIKKEYLNLNVGLNLVYEINEKNQDPNQSPKTISDEIKLSRKAQKLILHIKKIEMVIIKNGTKHFHYISSQLTSKDLLIDLKIPNKIISLQIQNEQSSKKIDIDLTKFQSTLQSSYENYSVLNPLQFIEEGIKLRASKMQSAGKIKKIVWDSNSAKRIESANVGNPLINQQTLHQTNLTPFNENFQSLCPKKLDFSKFPQKEKQGMFAQLQKQMDKDEFEDSILRKFNETKKRTLQMPTMKHKSKPDCTLKQKNGIPPKPRKIDQSQKVKNQFHSRQVSDHSQQNLQNFFNIDTQKLKQKKKSISYKTDMSNLCAFSKSVKVIDSIKKPSNKQNMTIQEKAVMAKKGILESKKMVPNRSFVGATMVKSIRMRTEMNN